MQCNFSAEVTANTTHRQWGLYRVTVILRYLSWQYCDHRLSNDNCVTWLVWHVQVNSPNQYVMLSCRRIRVQIYLIARAGDGNDWATSSVNGVTSLKTSSTRLSHTTAVDMLSKCLPLSVFEQSTYDNPSRIDVSGRLCKMLLQCLQQVCNPIVMFNACPSRFYSLSRWIDPAFCPFGAGEVRSSG